MMEKLNERLVYLRKNANLTQQQLADKLHISNKTISQWETGRTLPDIVTLVRLAEIYDMKLDELLNQKDQNAIPNEIMTKTLLMGNYKDYLLFAYCLLIGGTLLFYGIYFYLHHFSIPYTIKLIFDLFALVIALRIYQRSQAYQISRKQASTGLFNVCSLWVITQLLVMACANLLLQKLIAHDTVPYVYLTFSDYIRWLPILVTISMFVLLLMNTVQISISKQTIKHSMTQLLIIFTVMLGGSFGLYRAAVNRVDTITFDTQQSYDTFKDQYQWLLYVYDLDIAYSNDLKDIDPTGLDKAIESIDRLIEYRGIIGFNDEARSVYKKDPATKSQQGQPLISTILLLLDGLSIVWFYKIKRRDSVLESEQVIGVK